MTQVINNLMELLAVVPIKTCCDNCGMRFHMTYFHQERKAYRNDKGDVICTECKNELKKIRDNKTKNVHQLLAGGNHD